MESPLYQGHAIFRNQPPCNIFDKSYEDPTDVLFCDLNVIHPEFLKANILQKCQDFLKPQLLIDPRNGQAVTRFEYDYTQSSAPTTNIKIYRFPNQQSNISQHVHTVGLRILRAQACREEIDEEDLYIWTKHQAQLQRERAKYQLLVMENEKQNKQILYEHLKYLTLEYKKWYKEYVELLLKTETNNIPFNTHLGLPHLKVIATEKQCDIHEPKILYAAGDIPLWSHTKILKTLKTHFEDYVTKYIESLSHRVEYENKIRENLLNSAEDKLLIWASLESLLFLLCAGDNLDLPTEMLFNIVPKNANECKQIIFENPLPARHCGWHTNGLVFNKAFQSFAEQNGNFKWFKLEDGNLKAQAEENEKEINASLKQQQHYKAYTYEEYLNLPQVLNKKLENNIKCHANVVKWSLKESEQSEGYEFMTLLDNNMVFNEKNPVMGNSLFKLENKPQFGSEILTKYELLSMWLKQKLLSDRKEMPCCALRIAGKGLELLSTQNFYALAEIEQHLLKYYKINTTKLLSKLWEFLQTFPKLPEGKYMLRYDAKFTQNMLLCMPSKEITQSTIYLHDLIKKEPSELLFMTQEQPYLGLDPDLVSCINIHHKTLPCAFGPNRNKTLNSMKQSKKKKLEPLINDRELKLKLKSESAKRFREKCKAFKRLKNRKRRQAKKLKAKEVEISEIDKDMQADRILYGFGEENQQQTMGIAKLK